MSDGASWWTAYKVPGAALAGGVVCGLVASGLLGWALNNVGVAPGASTAPRVADTPAADSVDDAALAAGGGGAAVAPGTRRRQSEQTYRDAILARNLFDSSKVGVDAGCLPGEPGCEEEQPTTVADLDVTLKGTVVSNVDAYSAAFFVEKGNESVEAYGIGQTVSGAEILSIHGDYVMLLHNNQQVRLGLGDEAKAKGTKKPEPADSDGEEGIDQESETEFTIDRSLVDEQLSDLAGLGRMARAFLHRAPDGSYDGYRLSAIRRNTLPDKLGIKNGDIVHEVNGMPLTSLDGAMQALEALRSESDLEAVVTRRGERVTLKYTIE